MAGYSETPLQRKLGIREGHRVSFAHAPASFAGALGELPGSVEVHSTLDGPLDLIVYFTTARADLERDLDDLRASLDPAGGLWVAWPKRSSGVPSTVTEDVVREVALPTGLVDNKVAAIDDVWSGLRLVVRRSERPGAGKR
jgi:hypothetical protein